MNSRRRIGMHVPSAKRCAIYTRKSIAAGLEQEFNSLDAQREACEQYVASQAHSGWVLVPERYDDGGFSGASLGRPAFQRLMADVESNRVDVVVVYKLDRLSRSLRDFGRIMDAFERRGAAFVSVTQRFNTADAMGKLTLNMLMSFAEFEREMIAERTRDKVAASRRHGKFTGGRAPIGYAVQDKRLVIAEHEAEVVRAVFDSYEAHGSGLAVAQVLNAAGRTTKDYVSKSGREQKGRRWTKEAVLRVLQNPVYAGFMRCGDELHESEHEPLVSREQFARVQAALEAHGGAPQDHGRNPAYILRGILKCALCGLGMTPASSRKGDRVYRYYRCVTRDKHGQRACGARPLPAASIEGFVINKIRAVTAGGNLDQDVASSLEERSQRQRKSLFAERRALASKIARISSEGSSMAEQLASLKGTARRLLEARIEGIGAQLAEHEARLDEVEKVLATLASTAVEAQWVAEALANFDAIWDAMIPQNRARLVRALVQCVEVDERAGTVTAVLVDIGADPNGAEPAAAPATYDHASP